MRRKSRIRRLVKIMRVWKGYHPLPPFNPWTPPPSSALPFPPLAHLSTFFLGIINQQTDNVEIWDLMISLCTYIASTYVKLVRHTVRLCVNFLFYMQSTPTTDHFLHTPWFLLSHIPGIEYLYRDSLDLFNFANNIKIMGKKSYIQRTRYGLNTIWFDMVVWTWYIQRLEDLNEASEAVDVTCSDGVQPKTIVLCPWFEEDNRWFSAYLTQKSSFAAAFYVYISMHAISIRITYQYLSHILHSDER